MLHTIFKQLAAMLVVVALCIPAAALKAGMGVDSYEIYLNNKLVMKASLAAPFSLQSLPLDKAGPNDRLVIYYRHCHGEKGTNRGIVLKDEKGNTLQEWKFGNAATDHDGMTIPVKELQQLNKQYAGGGLRLYYTSEQLPKGQVLAAIRLNGQQTT